MTTSLEAHPDQAHAVEHAANIVFRLGSSHDRYTAQMRRSFDINAHERLAMTALWSHGPMTMTELGQWIPLSRAAVTTLVDRLEAAGIMTRGTDDTDRRRTVVTLSQDAVEKMVPVVRPWGEGLAKLTATRTAEEWQIIASFIEEVRLLNEEHADRLSAMDDATIQALASGSAQSEGNPA